MKNQFCVLGYRQYFQTRRHISEQLTSPPLTWSFLKGEEWQEKFFYSPTIGFYKCKAADIFPATLYGNQNVAVIWASPLCIRTAFPAYVFYIVWGFFLSIWPRLAGLDPYNLCILLFLSTSCIKVQKIPIYISFSR